MEHAGVMVSTLVTVGWCRFGISHLPPKRELASSV